jgi:hypothetical protein
MAMSEGASAPLAGMRGGCGEKPRITCPGCLQECSELCRKRGPAQSPAPAACGETLLGGLDAGEELGSGEEAG